MTDNDRTFLDLSVVLKRQLDAVLENQNLLVAINRTLAKLNPQFEETLAKTLTDLKAGKGTQQDQKIMDQMAMWRDFAYKTLDGLGQK